MPSPAPELDVSVVIPAHDAADFLLEAVDSVLGQTLVPKELIVVDDGSVDATPEIAVARAGVRCIRLPRNLGQAAALNRGITESSGAFLAFLDADDVWLPRKLEQQRAAFEIDPALDAVYGLVRERVIGGAGGVETRDGRVLPAHLPSAVLLRRDAFERVGGFDERWRVGSVVDWYARALERGLRVRVLSEVVYERRIHGGNLGLSKAHGRDDYLAVVHAALRRRRSECEANTASIDGSSGASAPPVAR